MGAFHLVATFGFDFGRLMSAGSVRGEALHPSEEASGLVQNQIQQELNLTFSSRELFS
jgi:hypothetical protein